MASAAAFFSTSDICEGPSSKVSLSIDPLEDRAHVLVSGKRPQKPPTPSNVWDEDGAGPRGSERRRAGRLAYPALFLGPSTFERAYRDRTDLTEIPLARDFWEITGRFEDVKLTFVVWSDSRSLFAAVVTWVKYRHFTHDQGFSSSSVVYSLRPRVPCNIRDG